MSDTSFGLVETDPHRASGARLVEAVSRNRSWTPAGLSERLFARLFQSLVYAQIWEDPEVDIEAMQLRPGHRIVAIASGGCNAMSYLSEDPASVDTVDLNPAHVAFNGLKNAALAHLPDYETFYRFFGAGDHPDNPDLYRRLIRPSLDRQTRLYWDGRDTFGRPRINLFVRNHFRQGLLGRFIGAAHWVARRHGVDPAGILKAGDLAAQRAFFDEQLAPLLDRPLIRTVLASRSSLFGLGIPPQQYDELAASGNGSISDVLKTRLEKLACGFPLSQNYFALQAFGRAYDKGGALPLYLQRETYQAIRSRAGRLSIQNRSLTEMLAARPTQSVDRFVLLDAQDWMNAEQLNDLWREIGRTAAPSARVIFRTAGRDTVLPGKLAGAELARWTYLQARSAELHDRDRSAIYGGFHIYELTP